MTRRAAYDFIGKSRRWFVLSGVVILAGLVSLFTRGLNQGIDFKGGTSWEVKAPHVSVTRARDALRPIGIRLSQGNVLAVTAKLGVARPAEVCDILELDASTLSRTVDRMVENGWLEIVPDEDGRSQPFRLTDEGRRLMERSVPAWEKAQAEAKKLLGEDGLRLLDAAIKRVKSTRPTS